MFILRSGYTTPSKQTALSHLYENSSVTSTRTSFTQTTYYKSENVSMLNGERELTSSILNIKTHSSSANTTSSDTYLEVGASNILERNYSNVVTVEINPSKVERTHDSTNTSKLLLVMVTFALLFGLVTCFYTIFSKIRHYEKRQNHRQSTHLAKIRTYNHVVDLSMTTAKSAAGYPTRTRSHTQALPARPSLESRHAHARSEPISDMSDTRDLVEQEGTDRGGNLLASNPLEGVYCGVGDESEVGGSDEKRGQPRLKQLIQKMCTPQWMKRWLVIPMFRHYLKNIIVFPDK